MSNKLLFIVLGVVLLLVVGMGGGLMLMWSKLSAMNTQLVAANAPVSGQHSASQPFIGPIVPLETFIVNLADPGGKRFLRVTVDLELTDAAVESELQTRMPQVRNAVLMVLPNKRFEDISSSDGKLQLRDELIQGINQYLAAGQVRNIYFKEFVVQ